MKTMIKPETAIMDVAPDRAGVEMPVIREFIQETIDMFVRAGLLRLQASAG